MKTRRFLAVTVGVMALSVGVMLTSGHRDAQAASPPDNPGIPFQAILDKLDQVLAAITGAAGQNNHSLRWDTNNPVGVALYHGLHRRGAGQEHRAGVGAGAE